MSTQSIGSSHAMKHAKYATFGILGILVSGGVAGGVLGGCATSEEAQDLPPPRPVRDSGTGPADTSVGPDARGTDAAADASDGGPKDTGADTGSCTPSTTQTKACGKCGTSTRTCSSAGTWGTWSGCMDEKALAACSIGEVRAASCGKCGTVKDTCDPITCEWSVGLCLGEGACTAGETETTSASCPVAGEVRTRTCSDKCAWGAFGDCTLPKGWLKMTAPTTEVDGRYWHSAVWTGTEMIVYGGYGTYVSSNYLRNNGGAYRPSADTWRSIATPTTAVFPSPNRWQHTAVWTGARMIVWGGLNSSSASTSWTVNTGAAYDPAMDAWSSIATPTLSARYGHQAVWSTTTNEMIVWGGQSSSCTSSYCNDGAAYDPATNSWRPIPAPPIAGRWRHTMIWTGTEVVVWGGQGSGSAFLRDGARFDPKTNVWTKFPDPVAGFDGRIESAAVWTGTEVLVWGGHNSSIVPYSRNDGARYLPSGSWSTFTAPAEGVFAAGTSSRRFATQAWFGNGKLWLWSGATTTSSSISATAASGGAWYDPATDTWGTMDLTGAPTTNRARATVVWTGKEAILWGGASSTSGSTFYQDGAVYRP
jgi:N-acetylneuraminic acid mutarotase